MIIMITHKFQEWWMAKVQKQKLKILLQISIRMTPLQEIKVNMNNRRIKSESNSVTGINRPHIES